MEDLHDELRHSLRYFDGHSDTLGLFADAAFLSRAGAALAKPFRDAQVDKVAGIEARGFVLATAVALTLRAGFVAIRKRGTGLFPGHGPQCWRLAVLGGLADGISARSRFCARGLMLRRRLPNVSLVRVESADVEDSLSGQGCLPPTALLRGIVCDDVAGLGAGFAWSVPRKLAITSLR